MSKRRDVADLVAADVDLGSVIDGASDTGTTTPRGVGDIYVEGCQTVELTKAGPVVLLPFALLVEQEVTRSDGKTLHGVIVSTSGPAEPFRLQAEILGDPRALSRALAGALGVRYREAGRRLTAARDAWLAASAPERIRCGDDFGFTSDGRSFVLPNGSLPHGELHFAAPELSSARALDLPPSNPPRAVELAALLLELWPAVLGDPRLARVLLGVVGWALVAPALEARDSQVSPLIPFLVGRSGAGKSTHAGLVQSFFGDFGNRRAALSFGSTALSVEEESYWFHGAVMVVGDVKAGVMGEGGSARWLALLQRAGDRGERRRLDVKGSQQAARASRGTLFFEGEDLPVEEASALARLLVLRMPAAPRNVGQLHQLEAIRKELPILARALVDHLLERQPWRSLLDAYDQTVARLTARLGPANNAVRLARSAAAVLVGGRVWSAFLGDQGLELPSTSQEATSLLVDAARGAIQEVEEGSPAQVFLHLVEQVIAMGGAWLEGVEPGAPRRGDCIGKGEPGVWYLMPDPSMAAIRRHLPDAAARLKPAASIAEDLHQCSLLADCDKGRRTKKKRVVAGQPPINTWAIRRQIEDSTE